MSPSPLQDLQKVSIENLRSWVNIESELQRVAPEFLEKLAIQYPSLTSREQQICAMLRLRRKTKDIQAILGGETATINNTRYRIRQKLNLSPSEDLESALMRI